MASPDSKPPDANLEAERRRKIRRNVWLLALLAVGFYVAFILMSLSRSQA